jgi:soluble lytic murein transglycosylase-like protein
VRLGAVLAAVVVVVLVPALARADLYTFVDAEGVIHFTNIPDDPRYALYPLERKVNTWTLQDGLGTLRTVHRVDVRTYDQLIVEAARYYALPAALVKAVMAVESSFEPAAVSSAGAQGLMQLIPPTAREMFVRDAFDPRDNVYGGVRYLRILTNHFSGDLRRTIAAYNAGPNAVRRAGDVPDFAETRTYVQRVLALYRHYLEHWQPEG